MQLVSRLASTTSIAYNATTGFSHLNVCQRKEKGSHAIEMANAYREIAGLFLEFVHN
jgi:hypothetical protein